MFKPNYILLYVEDVARSVEFYNKLIGQEPVEHSQTFALYVMPNGVKLGMWLKGGVEPTATQTGGGMEVGMPLDSNEEVDAFYAKYQELGLTVAQTPTEMDFGYTFSLLDPDDHRLRFFCLADE